MKNRLISQYLEKFMDQQQIIFNLFLTIFKETFFIAYWSGCKFY